ECEEDNERSNNYKNKNQVPNVSSLSSHKEIAENVLKIRNAYHCNVHNRPCINKESHKDFHVEITFMMLSIWASDMNKGLATVKNPPTHPLFSYANISSKKRLPSSYLQSPPTMSSQMPLVLPSSPPHTPHTQVQLTQPQTQLSQSPQVQLTQP
ncbi:1550_t:CDS:2, partial [Ambispora leptoticha]